MSFTMHRWLLCLVLLAGAPTAYAQDAPEKETPPKTQLTEEQQKQATEHYKRGREFRTFGAYDDAIREFLAGFELSGDPAFLFNLAQTYRENRDKQMALDYYKKYVELAPDGTGALLANSHIAVLERLIAEETAEAERKKKAAEESEKKAQGGGGGGAHTGQTDRSARSRSGGERESRGRRRKAANEHLARASLGRPGQRRRRCGHPRSGCLLRTKSPEPVPRGVRCHRHVDR